MTQQAPFYAPMTRRHFLHLAAGVTATWTLAACAAGNVSPATQGTTTSAPQRGGVLRIALTGPIIQFDPMIGAVYEDYVAMTILYETLVTVDAALTPQPKLALTWQPTDDFTSWIFTLRPGVQFHHGKPLTADDVVYTFQRAFDPNSGSTVASIIPNLAGVEAVDDGSSQGAVRITLSSPSVALPALLATSVLGIVPADRTSEQIASEPSGTGPFRFAAHEPGARTRLDRNPTYWEADLPYLDEVQCLILPEAAAQVNAIAGETVDILWSVPGESMAALEAAPGVALVASPVGQHEIIVLRTDQPPFDDLRVRQALKHCLDRPAIVQAVLQGRGEVGNDQPVAPSNPYWANIPPLAYDLERAKALLAEAGFANGLDLTLITSAVVPNGNALAVVFQEMVKPAGVNVQIEVVPPESYWSQYYLQTPVFVSFWTLVESVEAVFNLGYYSSSFFNEAGWQNPTIDQLVGTAQAEADETKRQELYAELQRLLSVEGGSLIPYFHATYTAVRTVVQGLTILPTSWIDPRAAWLAPG